jgi:hypothetical protein
VYYVMNCQLNCGIFVTIKIYSRYPFNAERLIRRAVSPLKNKIHSKNMREKPTNASIINSVINFVS